MIETSPVFFYEPLNAYVVLRYDDVRRILDDSETYSSHAYKGTPVREDLRERIPEHWERVGQVISASPVRQRAPFWAWTTRSAPSAAADLG